MKAANEAVETVNKAKQTIDTLKNAANMTEAVANTDFKVSVNVGASKSVSTSQTEHITHQGSELSAGNIIIKSREGDTTISGSKLEAISAELSGDNVNLVSVEDSQHTRQIIKTRAGKRASF